MRKWASSRWGSHVQFLELCVESQECAVKFHRLFEFGLNPKPPTKTTGSRVVNGYIPGRDYMPVGYGQLGCSGFVISDAHGRFVTKKTSAYLQYGERAFRHVEAIIEEVLAQEREAAHQQRKPGEAAPQVTRMEREQPAVGTEANPIELESSSSTSAIKQEECDRKRPRKTIESISDKTDGLLSESSATTVTAPLSSSRELTNSPTSTALVDGLVQAPASCGVEAMDDEHEICTASFNRALKDPSLEHLQELYELLRAHFQHEEDLIAQYSTETPDMLASPFSVLSSHRKDHTRILTIAVRELQRIGLGGEAAAADGCTPSG